MVGTTGGLLVPEGITHPALARGYHPPGIDTDIVYKIYLLLNN